MDVSVKVVIIAVEVILFYNFQYKIFNFLIFIFLNKIIKMELFIF